MNEYTTRGMITLELVIALALVSILIGGTALYTAVRTHDGERVRAGERISALARAETVQRALRDATLLVATTTVFLQDGISYAYTAAPVHDIALTGTLLASELSWQSVLGVPLLSKFEDYVPNIQALRSPDACVFDSQTGAAQLQLVQTINLATLLGSGHTITDMIVSNGVLYVTLHNTSVALPTLLAIDVRVPSSSSILASLDNDLLNNSGLHGVAISGNFLFVASASSFVRGQLQIIDRDPLRVRTTYKIPTSIVSGSSGQGVGKSIVYHDGYVYLGLTKTVSGPELNIIDVRNPDAPVWVGGYSVGAAVNDMHLSDEYLYIVSPQGEELLVLDVRDKAHPVRVSGFDFPGSQGNGKSITRAANTLVVGRTISTQPELYTLAIAGSGAPTFATTSPGIEIVTSVNALVVGSSYLFGLTTSGLLRQFAFTGNTLTPVTDYTLAGVGVALTCADETLYAATVQGVDGNIYIFTQL